MSENYKEKGLSFAARASEWYADSTKMRAAMQVIPHVGGALDTLFSGKGAEIQRQRIGAFLQDLDGRLRVFEDAKPVAANDELFDFILGVFDRVVRARSHEKIKRFSLLVSKQVVAARPWDDAEAAVRIVGQLEDQHIDVLRAIASASAVVEGAEKLSASTLLQSLEALDTNPKRPLAQPLTNRFPQYTVTTLRMICAELVSIGLIHDDGVGRMGMKAMQLFAPTDLAVWLIDWLQDQGRGT